ncbi:aspartyl protease family protein [Dawidia soli]|uniref:Aspartyl protease family protein n=1 Tax=Dawidia soli TaxID=2782352 RepID=A0AAP2D9Z8_9BACT|nr:aspartyl protease family protein [Dawidia soli]MBT1688156.1 aspartyl protease family protein [Dawidia soli]
MATFYRIIVAGVLLLGTPCFALHTPTEAGFYLPSHLRETKFNYTVINNLIVLPVRINDSIQVNLILDTGCRNLVLFGKKFSKLFRTEPNRHVEFSGLGTGRTVQGKLSLGNTVAIDAVLGNRIPVVIIPEQNLFSEYPNVHGVIGYDLFIKFEVELHPGNQEITLRPAATASLPDGYQHVPIEVTDSRPLIQATVFLQKQEKGQACNLMIDTGSARGLLLKTTDLCSYRKGPSRTLGRGFNGLIKGYETLSDKLLLASMEMKNLTTGIIYAQWQNYASVGMEVLKEYRLVLNYCKGYAGFKSIRA